MGEGGRERVREGWSEGDMDRKRKEGSVSDGGRDRGSERVNE